MISRKTGLLIANIVANSFVHEVKESYNSGRNYKYVQRVNADVLRDFLFEYGVRGYSIEKICKVMKCNISDIVDITFED